jgi:hypothetical protein
MKNQPSPWADYLDARARLIAEWLRDGIPGSGEPHATPADIAEQLNHHDATQIQLISMTPLDPPGPCTSRALLAAIRAVLREERDDKLAHLAAIQAIEDLLS